VRDTRGESVETGQGWLNKKHRCVADAKKSKVFPAALGYARLGQFPPLGLVELRRNLWTWT
jgi:hypothetical protein